MTVNDKLITKVNAIDTCKFVLKAQYNTNKSGLKKIINGADKKVPHTSVFVKKQIAIQRSLILRVEYIALLAWLLPLLLILLRIRYPTSVI